MTCISKIYLKTDEKKNLSATLFAKKNGLSSFGDVERDSPPKSYNKRGPKCAPNGKTYTYTRLLKLFFSQWKKRRAYIKLTVNILLFRYGIDRDACMSFCDYQQKFFFVKNNIFCYAPNFDFYGSKKNSFCGLIWSTPLLLWNVNVCVIFYISISYYL